VPDILGNAGGVTVSYSDGSRTARGLLRESEVNERLFDVMDNAFDECALCGYPQVNNRIAAYMLASTGRQRP